MDARIAIEYKGALFNLKRISPFVFKDRIGIARHLLIIASILRHEYDENIEETIKKALDILVDSESAVMREIIVEGVAKGLRKLGIEAEARNGYIVVRDAKAFERLLDEVFETTRSVLETLSSPKRKIVAVQTAASVVEKAETVLMFPSED